MCPHGRAKSSNDIAIMCPQQLGQLERWQGWQGQRCDGLVGHCYLTGLGIYQNRTLLNAQMHKPHSKRLLFWKYQTWWASEFYRTQLRQNQNLCPKENWRRETRSKTSRSHRGSSEPWRSHLFRGFGYSTRNIHDSLLTSFNFYILCFTMFPLQFRKASWNNEAFRLQYRSWALGTSGPNPPFLSCNTATQIMQARALNKGSINWQGCTAACSGLTCLSFVSLSARSLSASSCRQCHPLPLCCFTGRNFRGLTGLLSILR